jgi:photosystem II stability/assembly factor-like uncharacterized protein
VKVARIVVLALVLTMSGAAQARTTRQPVPTSIAFWDRDHGLAAFVVYGPTDRSEGYLSTTADGGKTWKIRWRGTGVSYVATVPGTREAWAQIWPKSVCIDCPGLMIRSRDSGRTWRRAGTAPSRPSFPSRQVGFAMRSRQANSGPLMKTTNGGRSWRRVGAPCRRGWGGYAWSAALSFVSPRRGWLICTGQPGAGNQSKALYTTANGGVTWKRLLNVYFEPARNQLGGLQRAGYPHGISFTGNGRGLLWSDRGSTFRTRDGGRHWLPVRATRHEEQAGLSGWQVNDRVGYLLLQVNARRYGWRLLRTENGGRTWRLVRSWLRR